MADDKAPKGWGIGSVFGSVKNGVGNLLGSGDGSSDGTDGDSSSAKPKRRTSVTKGAELVSQCSPVVIDEASGKPIAGCTMSTRRRKKEGSSVVLDAAGYEETHIWGDGDASVFNLRVGPNYAQTGAKGPSAPALYDIAGIDLYQSDSRICNIGSQVALPKAWTNLTTNHEDVPPVFIVVCQLPDVSNALSGLTNFFVDKSEGPGTTVVMYYTIKAGTAEKLKDLASCQPALKLFVEFCKSKKCGIPYNDPAHPMAGRFKVCPHIDNIDDIGLPGFIKMYNAKPALVAVCGDLYDGPGYLCMDTNVHAFGGAARTGMQIMSFENMLFRWGFAIESRTDEEMPEVLFGTCFVDKPRIDGSLPSFDEATGKKPAKISN